MLFRSHSLTTYALHRPTIIPINHLKRHSNSNAPPTTHLTVPAAKKCPLPTHYPVGIFVGVSVFTVLESVFVGVSGFLFCVMVCVYVWLLMPMGVAALVLSLLFPGLYFSCLFSWHSVVVRVC